MVQFLDAITQLSRQPMALTAMERLEAMSRFKVHAPAIEQWIGVLLLLVLLAMLVLLIWVSYNKIQYARLAAEKTFFENATRRSLSSSEYRLLGQIASKAGLKGQARNLIFTSADLYNKGLQRLAQEVLARQGPEEYERLIADAAFLQEKMGLKAGPMDAPSGQLAGSESRHPITTRDIPVGKILQVTRRLANQSDQITATLVGNDTKQLVVELQRPIKVTFGELWRVRYTHGVSVWEFDTTVTSFDGIRLALKHSSEVRFLNRRRFVRLATDGDALIAKLPFIQPMQHALDDKDLPIQFARAKVLELAGPGLRLISNLPAQVKERLLILFELVTEGQGHLVSDIATVRRVQSGTDGYILAVELTGHGQSEFEELLRLYRGLATGAGKPQHHTEQQGADQDSVIEQLVTEGTRDV
ncbi:MAG: hypothetical protein QHH07_04905 [Sedimentisphaerales bacterium]|nr:hypothetical protein [Sedimentisphaerales bacterium]